MTYTNCIKERFDGFFAEMPENERENASRNCAIALDFIGAGKIKSDEMGVLLTAVINAEFKSEQELLEYISKIRNPRKPREMSQETKEKRFAEKLAKLKAYYGIKDEEQEQE